MARTKPSAIDDILAEHSGLEHQLADPALHNDPVAARRAGKRFAALGPIMSVHSKLTSAQDDLAAARELAADDASFATVDKIAAAIAQGGQKPNIESISLA